MLGPFINWPLLMMKARTGFKVTLIHSLTHKDRFICNRHNCLAPFFIYGKDYDCFKKMGDFYENMIIKIDLVKQTYGWGPEHGTFCMAIKNGSCKAYL